MLLGKHSPSCKNESQNVIQKFIQKLRLFLENYRFWKMGNKPQDDSKNDLFSRRFIFCILSIIILKVKRHNYFLTQRFHFWVRKWSYILQKMMQKSKTVNSSHDLKKLSVQLPHFLTDENQFKLWATIIQTCHHIRKWQFFK